MTRREIHRLLSHAFCCYGTPYAARCSIEDIARLLTPPEGLLTSTDDPRMDDVIAFLPIGVKP